MYWHAEVTRPCTVLDRLHPVACTAPLHDLRGGKQVRLRFAEATGTSSTAHALARCVCINSSDLSLVGYQISAADVQETVAAHGVIVCLEASAVSGEGVAGVFNTIGMSLIDSYRSVQRGVLVHIDEC
jgi:hypothetical protein